jgi:hypothetical protein
MRREPIIKGDDMDFSTIWILGSALTMGLDPVLRAPSWRVLVGLPLHLSLVMLVAGMALGFLLWPVLLPINTLAFIRRTQTWQGWRLRKAIREGDRSILDVFVLQTRLEYIALAAGLRDEDLREDLCRIPAETLYADVFARVRAGLGRLGIVDEELADQLAHLQINAFRAEAVDRGLTA